MRVSIFDYILFQFHFCVLCLVSREKVSIWRCLCSHIHRLPATFFMSARPPLLFSFLFIYTQQQQQNIAAHGSLSLSLSQREPSIFVCTVDFDATLYRSFTTWCAFHLFRYGIKKSSCKGLLQKSLYTTVYKWNNFFRFFIFFLFHFWCSYNITEYYIPHIRE